MLYAARLSHGEDADLPRLGITVSKRVGNAVARNRIKRRVRECFRTALKHRLPAGFAIVVIARTGADQIDSPTIHAELKTATLTLMRRLGV